MAFYNNLCRKMEDVLHGYLGPSVTDGVTLYRFADAIAAGEELKSERVEIACPRSVPFTEDMDAAIGATNRRVTCTVKIRTPADVQRNEAGTDIGTSRDRHDANVGAMMDALYVDGLVVALNGIGVANIGVNDVSWPTEEIEIDTDAYTTTLTFEVGAYSRA